jgi:hypothetical protein
MKSCSPSLNIFRWFRRAPDGDAGELFGGIGEGFTCSTRHGLSLRPANKLDMYHPRYPDGRELLTVGLGLSLGHL